MNFITSLFTWWSLEFMNSFMLSEVDFLSKSPSSHWLDLRKSPSEKSICYIETRNEIHFLLDLICTMGIICFPLVYDRSDTDLAQS